MKKRTFLFGKLFKLKMPTKDKTYSPEYVKILKFFVENILWEKLNEHNIEYLTEYVRVSRSRKIIIGSFFGPLYGMLGTFG